MKMNRIKNVVVIILSAAIMLMGVEDGTSNISMAKGTSHIYVNKKKVTLKISEKN